MKLYIKQKAFSFADRFSIYDASGNPKYWAEGELFTMAKRLHVYDEAGEEVVTVKQELWNWLPTYAVYYKGKQFATIRSRFSLRPRYEIEGPGWLVEGNFMGLDYTISSDSRQIATINKKWMSWGDSYEVDIDDPIDELPVLSVVLGIDAAVASSGK
ncbi:MAG: hypothetical protein GX978_04710 [Tissierellia bacterium]|nr:hypothetical protein [Tissierellia bacterium]